MDYQELEKTTVSRLREMAKEYPELKGVSGMKKQDLVDTLAEKMGVNKPHKEVAGLDKAAVKAEIRAVKKLRDQALDARDHAKLKDSRRQLHRLRRALRKATVVAA